MDRTADTTCNVEENAAHAISQGEKRSSYRWLVMGLIFLVWSIACADRANFGIALPFMKKEYHITNTEAGLIVSLFNFAYGFVQIPVGLMYKRLSEKTTGLLFSVFMLLTSAFTGLMGTTSSVFLLQTYRIGLGLSEGPLGIRLHQHHQSLVPSQREGYCDRHLDRCLQTRPAHRSIDLPDHHRDVGMA